MCTGLLLLLRVSMCIPSKAWTLNAYLSPGIGISGVVTMALYIISISILAFRAMNGHNTVNQEVAKDRQLDGSEDATRSDIDPLA